MKRTILLPLLIIFLFSGFIAGQQKKGSAPEGYKPVPAAIEDLEKDIPRLMTESKVVGMSAALVRNGKLVWSKGFGVMNAETKEPVTSETIFEANSLSKPLFAYAVLKLVDEGKFDLDRPVLKYMGENYHVSDDPQINLVTGRMLLSHQSGVQWDGEDKVKFGFAPREKFEYSPVGIDLLGKVVEKITGMKIEDFIRQTVLEPLGMKDSSYVWMDKYDKLRVYQHDSLGNLKPGLKKWKSGAPCCSLQTTPVDYARFVIAIMDHKLIKKKNWDEMFKPQIGVNEKWPQVSWGLGWGLETTEEGESFWHWGDGGESKSYITAFLPRKDAVIFFANSANGLFFTREILADAIGGKHMGIDWLGYDRYDSPSWKLLKSIMAGGAASALKKYLEQRQSDAAQKISENQINNLGYQLLSAKKIDDAIEVFKQNTVDFPESGNVWDSLAEAYMNKGDKESAIKYYEKSLKLDPNNKNAVEQLKKLKE